MTGKVGRNDPCPCGSGRKFKKCCGGPLARALLDPRPLVGPHPTGRPPLETLWQRKRVRAVGNTLYLRPPSETFHDFLPNLLRIQLGKDWYNSELAKPPHERHQILRWFFRFQEWQEREMKPENKVPGGWSAPPSGDVQALMALAFDVYVLLHTQQLSSETFRRLKKWDAFQGARYEIAVAAIFARLGCRLDYLPAATAGRHVEFIAAHPSGTRIAVEAKSRHRPGVLHQPGTANLDVLRADVHDLLKRALDQTPDDIPSVIFIDLNLPPSPGRPAPEKPWFQDLTSVMDRLDGASGGRPDRFSAVFFTNFAYHYDGPNRAGGIEYVSVFSQKARHPVPAEILAAIHQAVHTYGLIPKE